MSTPTADVADTPPAAGRGRRGLLRGALVAGAAAAALVAGTLAGGEEAQAAAELVPFDDCAAVDAWYTEQALEQVSAWGLTGGAGGGITGWWRALTGGQGDDMGGAAAESADGSGLGGPVGAGPTGTNLQEEGVDEPDLVKTDGRRVVTLTGTGLHVVTVDGDRLTPAGRLMLPRQWPQELLLLGNTALVVGNRSVDLPEPEPLPDPEPGLPDPEPGGATGASPDADLPAPSTGGPDERIASPIFPAPSTTVLTVVDLAGTAPRLVRTEEVEATYLSARASGGAVRVVLASTPVIPFPAPELSASGGLADEDATERANEAAVEAMDGAAWLPHRVVRDDAGQVVSREPAVTCDALAHPADPAGLGTVTVLTLDADAADMATTDTVAVASDGGIVYASLDRLYVATTRGGWGFPMPVDMALPVPGDREGRTELHGFDTTDPARTTYVASGAVDGTLLGRWAIDAQDGLLRVATTTDAGESESAVTVLREANGRLEVVGAVGGLGRTERVRAVRWFGDLAVVVTFRQTDPLYTVDLSDPAAPVVRGELKIPGYSAYLHPIGDDMLLGVGQDATEEGMATGAQMSSFDLGNLDDPRRLATLTYRNAWTDVESDSRAFTYLPERRTAMLPLSAPGGSGVVAVTVGTDGTLTEAGRWTSGGELWVARAIPVGADDVVVVTEGEQGRSLILLAAADLDERDTLALGS